MVVITDRTDHQSFDMFDFPFKGRRIRIILRLDQV